VATLCRRGGHIKSCCIADCLSILCTKFYRNLSKLVESTEKIKKMWTFLLEHGVQGHIRQYDKLHLQPHVSHIIGCQTVGDTVQSQHAVAKGVPSNTPLGARQNLVYFCILPKPCCVGFYLKTI